jgi:plastocyanin
MSDKFPKTLAFAVAIFLLSLMMLSACGKDENTTVKTNTAPATSGGAANTNAENKAPANAETKANVETKEITIENYAYNPAQITVAAGTKINWTNKDKIAHTVTADDKSFDSGLLKTNAGFSKVFSSPGTFAYHCTPHPNMKAQIVVQ